jgi:ribosomal-protein-alanine N-acetyltransferase
MRALAGDGLLLEPQVEAHAHELFEILRDPALYKYLDYDPPPNEDAVRLRLRKLESRRSSDGTEDWLNWIVRNAEGKLVGYVQATVYPDRHADIGYVIGSAYWRRGYALAATRAMVTELAGRYGVERLRATIDPANEGSWALLVKLGFGEILDETTLPDLCFSLELMEAR